MPQKAVYKFVPLFFAFLKSAFMRRQKNGGIRKIGKKFFQFKPLKNQIFLFLKAAYDVLGYENSYQHIKNSELLHKILRYLAFKMTTFFRIFSGKK